MSETLPELLASIPADGVSLETLADLANRALDGAHLEIEDKRTAERLDGRTIRFYQTLSIIPRPTQYAGRRAYYERHHLIRAVAAKQLQSEGYSLAQIQSELPGRSSDELLALLTKLRPPAVGRAGDRAESRQAFDARRSSSRADSPPTATSRPLVAREIAPGVVVTIDPARVAHAEALLATLVRTSLTHISAAERTSNPGEDA
jgi:DNA-binding transcriptional MerR regulator